MLLFTNCTVEQSSIHRIPNFLVQGERSLATAALMRHFFVGAGSLIGPDDTTVACISPAHSATMSIQKRHCLLASPESYLKSFAPRLSPLPDVSLSTATLPRRRGARPIPRVIEKSLGTRVRHGYTAGSIFSHRT